MEALAVAGLTTALVLGKRRVARTVVRRGLAWGKVSWVSGADPKSKLMQEVEQARLMRCGGDSFVEVGIHPHEKENGENGEKENGKAGCGFQRI